MVHISEREQIEQEIKALMGVELLIETNSGTFGATEACHQVGSGDPMFAERKVYETVAGVKRATGPAEDDAPGRMRRINTDSMSEHRSRLANLRKLLRGMKK
jgi:hypothetical protein